MVAHERGWLARWLEFVSLGILIFLLASLNYLQVSLKSFSLEAN
jgi:hypothetical protein